MTRRLLELDPTTRLGDDPWSLAHNERRVFLSQMQSAQQHWLAKLANLVEPPTPGRDFPAFLLATPRFGSLRRAIEPAASRRDLDTATADELQRFVDAYRDYLTAAI